MPRDARILILAQTNPCFSHRYLETVCTAGVTEDGEWIRLYPLRKRLLSEDKKYHKYQWVECKIDPTPQNHDCRPESHKVDQGSIIPRDLLPTTDNWAVRRRFLLSGNFPIYQTKEQILEGVQNNRFSLCFFQPTSVLTFFGELENSEFTDDEKGIIKQHCDQGILFCFDDEVSPSSLNFKKIPYSFHCKFKDRDGVEMNLSVLDWEMSTLYRNCKNTSDQYRALEKTLYQYNNFIRTKDIYFVLGTRNREHNILRHRPESNINPWSIISVMYFPKLLQLELGL